MTKKNLLLTLSCLFIFYSLAQAQWQHRPDVKILNTDGTRFEIGASSGLNAPQISMLDTNGDGLEELVVFDRTSSKISVFGWTSKGWAYTPQHEALFPQVQDWCLLVDFDRDGHKDLFTSSRIGIRVFRNVPKDGKADFRLFRDPVRTKGVSGSLISLQIDVTDIPILKDFDSDGDLDILSFAASIGQFVEYNQNFSVERFGRPDSLIFEKVESKWGNIKECLCDAFAFNGSDCRLSRLQHAGSTMLAFDQGQDGDLDILIGDVDCPRATFLENFGTNTRPFFSRLDNNFPPESPVFMPTFPAFFYEDLDQNGAKDLLVAPNTYFNEGNKIDFRQPLHFYKNMGKDDNPSFAKADTNFLSRHLIDLGEDTQPAAADFDADGDDDLVVGYRGLPRSDGLFAGGMAYFENTGTNSEPSLALRSTDFLNLQSRLTLGVKPFFADLNKDGILDLAFSDTSATAIKFWPNLASQSEPLRFEPNTLLRLPLGVSDLYHAVGYDFDGDSDQDLLVSLRRGTLLLLENKADDGFVLKESNYLGLSDNFLKREPSLALVGLRESSSPSLMVLDVQGYPTFYQDFETGNSNSEVLDVKNSRSNPRGHHFGQRAGGCQLGDFLVFGGRGGGLHFLAKNEPTGLQQDMSSSILGEILPNPFQDYLQIKTFKKLHYKLLNSSGQCVLEGYLQAQLTEELSTLKLPSGLYFLVLESQNHIQSFKLVKN